MSSGYSLAGEGLTCHLELHRQNLGSLNGAELEEANPALFEKRDLVTASALLDLVSESWLRALARHCRRAGAAALVSLTYDGRFCCSPAEPEDELVRHGMNEHQRRDKGLGGPAEGPAAVTSAERCFVDEGYAVASEASDWVLGPECPAMHRRLIDGWTEAATEALPHQAAAIASWRQRRLTHVDAGRSHLVVGHRDLAAWLD
jgi:hypothetical protein